jgi:tetratricopeptide (TPR) repeat protein
MTAMMLCGFGTIGAAQAAPNPIDALPADAAGIFLLNSDPATWQGLTRFGAFPADFSTPGMMFSQFAPELNFSTDIQPWIGDRVGVGFMADGQPVMIAPVADGALAAKFIDRLVSRQAKPAVVTAYRGVKIQSWPPSLPSPAAATIKVAPDLFKLPGFAIATLPSGYIVRTEKPEVIQQLIDRAAQPRLSTQPEMQQLGQDPHYAQALVAGFMDYGKVIPLIEAEQRKQAKTLPPMPGLAIPGFDFLQPQPAMFAAIAKRYGGVSGLVWTDPTGLRVQTRITIKQPLPTIPARSTATSQILNQVPGVSYSVSRIENLATFFQLFDLDLVTDPQQTNQTTPLRELSQKFLGLDDRELKSWMDREFAFFMFPSQQGFLARQFKVDLGLGLAIQTSDRAKAEATLGKLTKRLQENFGEAVRTQKRTINSVPVVSLEIVPKTPKGGLQKLSESQRQSFFSYSWVKPDTVLILSGVDSTLIPQPWQVLPNSANFKEAFAPLPQQHQGSFYLNGGASIAFIFNSVVPQLLGQEMAQSPAFDGIKASLGSVRSLAGTTEFQPNGPDNSIMFSDGLVNLGRAVKRSPLTADGWLQAGEERLANGDADWAIANFTQAIGQAPANPQAYRWRGQARIAANDFVGAIADLDQAIGLNPDGEIANMIYEQRGKAYFGNHDYGKAIADLDRTIINQIDLPASYLMRSSAHREVGEYRQAIADATQAIQLEPTIEAYSHRCYARARLGDWQSARVDCEQAQGQQIEDLEDWTFTARYGYVKVGLGDKAGLNDCQAAIEAEPENPHHYENQGLAYALRQENALAIKAFKQAIALFRQQRHDYGVDRVEKLIAALSPP